MGSCFASMTGTSVLQLRDRPQLHLYQEFHGRILVYGVDGGEKDETALAHAHRELALKKQLLFECNGVADSARATGLAMSRAYHVWVMTGRRRWRSRCWTSSL